MTNLIQKNFQYLLDIAKSIKSNSILKIKTIHQIGSRKSGKTVNDMIFCAIILLFDLKINIYVFRNMSNALTDTWNDFKNLINRFFPYVNFQISETMKTVKYKNSKVQFRSLHTIKNDNVKLTGLPSNIGCDFVVVWSEERYEISDSDYQNIEDAIRGCDRVLWINSCNPWSILNDYIKKTVSECPQNEKQIIETGEQFVIKNDTLYHYQNWTLNEFLPFEDRRKLKELETLDPISARVRSFGLVGMEAGGIYTHYLQKISRNVDYNEIEHFTAGLDYGFRNDDMATILVGFDRKFETIIPLEVWSWNNQIYPKTHEQLANEIILFYQKCSQKYTDLLRNQLIVYCDYSNYAFIEMLNNASKKLRTSYWLTFAPCEKFPVLDRIKFNKSAMSSSMIVCSINAQPLIDEWQLQIWEEGKILRPVDKNNHVSDSFDYAISPYVPSIEVKFNQYLRI